MTKKFNKQTAMATLAHNFNTVMAENEDLGHKIDRVLGDTKTKVVEYVNLVRECSTALGEKFILPEFDDKGNATMNFKDSAPQPEPQTEEKPKKNPKPENSSKKKLSKKAKKAEEEPDNLAGDRVVERVTAKAFPETLTIDGTEFTICHEDIKTFEDFNMDEYEYEFAFIWTQRDLRQFPYIGGTPGVQPKSFPDDLDLCQLIYLSDKGVVAYAVSDYTEGVYPVHPEDLDEFEGLRFCNGVEYVIYRHQLEDEPEEESAEEPEE